MEGLGYHRQLTQFRHRLDAWNDGDGDAHLTSLLHELEVFLVVVEQLRDGILRAQVLLLFQVFHIAFQVGRLLVFLRIASHSEVELRSWMLDGCAVGEESLVEAHHLFDQVRCVGVSAWSRGEATVLLGLVATKQHEVADAQELQVQQFVFYLFDGLSTADDVWLYGDVIPLLDG